MKILEIDVKSWKRPYLANLQPVFIPPLPALHRLDLTQVWLP